MNCYICEAEMELIRIFDSPIIGKSLEYQCPRCGEKIYRPFRKEE